MNHFFIFIFYCQLFSPVSIKTSIIFIMGFFICSNGIVITWETVRWWTNTESDTLDRWWAGNRRLQNTLYLLIGTVVFGFVHLKSAQTVPFISLALVTPNLLGCPGLFGATNTKIGVCFFYWMRGTMPKFFMCLCRHGKTIVLIKTVRRYLNSPLSFSHSYIGVS